MIIGDSAEYSIGLRGNHFGPYIPHYLDYLRYSGFSLTSDTALASYL